MTRLESLISAYLDNISALEKNLMTSRFSTPEKDSRRRELLLNLRGKLRLAEEAKVAGRESAILPRNVSELRKKLKAERDLRYHSTKNGS